MLTSLFIRPSLQTTCNWSSSLSNMPTIPRCSIHARCSKPSCFRLSNKSQLICRTTMSWSSATCPTRSSTSTCATRRLRSMRPKCCANFCITAKSLRPLTRTVHTWAESVCWWWPCKDLACPFDPSRLDANTIYVSNNLKGDSKSAALRLCLQST